MFKGNSADPETLLPQIDKLRGQFAHERFVLAGDRGVITQKQNKALRKLVAAEQIQTRTPRAPVLDQGGAGSNPDSDGSGLPRSGRLGLSGAGGGRDARVQRPRERSTSSATGRRRISGDTGGGPGRLPGIQPTPQS